MLNRFDAPPHACRWERAARSSDREFTRGAESNRESAAVPLRIRAAKLWYSVPDLLCMAGRGLSGWEADCQGDRIA